MKTTKREKRRSGWPFRRPTATAPTPNAPMDRLTGPPETFWEAYARQGLGGRDPNTNCAGGRP